MLTYQELIKKMKNKECFRLEFCIDGYNHYNSCVIDCYSNNPLALDKAYVIRFILTRDEKEGCIFVESFNEKEKLFIFKGIGRFTLKEVWKRVIVKNIIVY